MVNLKMKAEDLKIGQNQISGTSSNVSYLSLYLKPAAADLSRISNISYNLCSLRSNAADTSVHSFVPSFIYQRYKKEMFHW